MVYRHEHQFPPARLDHSCTAKKNKFAVHEFFSALAQIITDYPEQPPEIEQLGALSGSLPDELDIAAPNEMFLELVRLRR